MTTTTRSDTAKRRRLTRTAMLRATRGDRGPAIAVRSGRLHGISMCERCAAVFENKRWRTATESERAVPVGMNWTVCPACRQVAAGEFFGRVFIHGEEALHHEEEIRRRIAAVAARARHTQTERRVVSVERRGDGIEVLTTSQKLAHRIVRELSKAFGGGATLRWSGRDGELQASWRWAAGPAAVEAPRRGPAWEPGRVPAAHVRLPVVVRGEQVRAAAARVGKQVPDLEIQGRGAPLVPGYRALIERHVERWAGRYPELARVHVTIGRGRHHRTGFESAAIVAVYPGRTLRVAKDGRRSTDALHAALAAMTRELVHAHAERRRIVKSPGPRPRGSIKSIFRDAGYGFVLLEQGREAYFHRDSLRRLRFESLRPGTPVEVEVEEGREGLQASRVFPAGDRGRA